MDELTPYIMNVGTIINRINNSIATLNAIPIDFDIIMYEQIIDILNNEDMENDALYMEHATKQLHTRLTYILNDSNDSHRVNEFTVLFSALLVDIRMQLYELNVTRPYQFVDVKGSLFILKVNQHVYRQVND